MKFLSEVDADSLILWELERLRKSGLESPHLELTAWKARWRKEQLAHYLPFGWSLGVWTGEGDDRQWKGYYLAQTLLFFQGVTQTLWIEHLSFEEQKLGKDLIEAALRFAREKHLQRVIIGDGSLLTELPEIFGPWKPWGKGYEIAFS